MGGACEFIGYLTACGKPPEPGTSYCRKHLQARCCICGEQGTHWCGRVIWTGVVCGCVLCGNPACACAHAREKHPERRQKPAGEES